MKIQVSLMVLFFFSPLFERLRSRMASLSCCCCHPVKSSLMGTAPSDLVMSYHSQKLSVTPIYYHRVVISEASPAVGDMYTLEDNNRPYEQDNGWEGRHLARRYI
ncbi:hypothetical protein BDB00DRAFT_825401 [Zychaea mexicana]|uniref:uncharacterized protein n=1 Tax=Zychaea mexicana TaxID=64656 RepID=UPI0022FEBE3D|nr:uncharacterized protein BDB00DRAFT_825401 [Zychaea mexicana]KAI9492958.1 hypothetical protein BDB00DRAFT_825401 [Zychaea mexicana]